MGLNTIARRRNETWLEWAPVFIRLVIGFGFMAHGWAKLSRGPAGFAKLLAQIGAPLPLATAWFTTLVELIGGLLIFLGAFVAVVSVPLIIVMLVAFFTVHLKHGFSAIKTTGVTPHGPTFGPPGVEVNLLYIGGLVVFIMMGAGALSVDHLLANWSKSRRQPPKARQADRTPTEQEKPAAR